MTDKLIAIVRFKALPGVKKNQRFEVRLSPEGFCGSMEDKSACAFWNNLPACAKTDCEGPLDVYFVKVKP